MRFLVVDSDPTHLVRTSCLNDTALGCVGHWFRRWISDDQVRWARHLCVYIYKYALYMYVYLYIYIYIPFPHKTYISWKVSCFFCVHHVFFHALLKQWPINNKLEFFGIISSKISSKSFFTQQKRWFMPKKQKTHRKTKITCLGLKPKLLQKVVFLAC